MSKAHYKYVEAELYNYNDNLKYLEELREVIIDGTPTQGERVQSGVTSDPTADKANKLVSTTRLITLNRNIESIGKALRLIKNTGEPKKYRLVEMKYFEKEYTDHKIAAELYISLETYYRWKRDIIKLIGSYMGIETA